MPGDKVIQHASAAVRASAQALFTAALAYMQGWIHHSLLLRAARKQREESSTSVCSPGGGVLVFLDQRWRVLLRRAVGNKGHGFQFMSEKPSVPRARRTPPCHLSAAPNAPVTPPDPVGGYSSTPVRDRKQLAFFTGLNVPEKCWDHMTPPHDPAVLDHLQ